jgi:asparagine synthase (glutamine-hydrolysing)
MLGVCGIAGFFGPPSRTLLEAMTDAQAHRGPDGVGYLETPEASLGFRRLAIIDLATGDQPMASPDGRLQLVYNGEVYNFRELRRELEILGHRFRTTSDTEVVLAAYGQWGPDAFRRFNGMWGLAILDQRGPTPQLVLCRDHLGIKPLYHATVAGRLRFASEIKGILADPAVPRRPDETALHAYLAHGLFDHDERTFFEGIRSVPAASYLTIDRTGVRTTRYWEPVLADDGPADPAAFGALFKRAVERRLVADVPVGTCLSGGLDSSSITTVLAAALRRGDPDAGSLGGRLQAFAAVFPGDPIDESGYVDAVAAATGAEVHRVSPAPHDLIADLERWIWQVELPMVSSAPFAMWQVMRLARDHVTVLIDGQGGDELLGGYDVYAYVHLRQLLRERRFGHLVGEAVRLRDVLVRLVAQRLVSRLRRTDDAALLRPAFREAHAAPRDDRSQDDLKRRLVQDLTTYSLPPLLRYEDRISMANSLETRLPFLDQELVEAVLRLPSEALMDRGWSRRILREALRDVLPEPVYRRRHKIGFTTPEFRWFRALQPALERILRSESFNGRPYWDGPAVAEAFRLACAGRRHQSLVFWRIINAEVWLRVYLDGAAVGAAAADSVDHPIARHAPREARGPEGRALRAGGGSARIRTWLAAARRSPDRADPGRGGRAGRGRGRSVGADRGRTRGGSRDGRPGGL